MNIETIAQLGGKPRGRPFPKGHKNHNTGKKWDFKTKKKISDSHKKPENIAKSIKNLKKINNFGENNWAWKGGVTSEHNKIRTSIEYDLWRNSVFARDNFTDQKTGIKDSGNLVAHHILNFSSHPELRFAIDNGITLSVKTHKEFHRKYGKKNNSREQLLEYLLQ